MACPMAILNTRRHVKFYSRCVKRIRVSSRSWRKQRKPLSYVLEFGKTILMKTKTCNVKSVLSYGCETWEVATLITNKLQKFVNRSLRRIMSVGWSEMISNTELWEVLEGNLYYYKLGWQNDKDRSCCEEGGWMYWKTCIGLESTGSQAKQPWKRTVLGEEGKCCKTWSEVKMLGGNWVGQSCFTNALCF